MSADVYVILAQEASTEAVGSLRATVGGLATAIERLECTGKTALVSIVGNSEDRETQVLFSAIEGGNTAKVVTHTPMAERWQSQLDAAEAENAEYVWLGSSQGAPAAETLVWLMATIEDDKRCAMVVPDEEFPQHALLRRSALQKIGELTALPGVVQLSGTKLITLLTNVVAESGFRVAYRLQPVTMERRRADVPSDGTAAAVFGGVVPGNIMVGPHTYTGGGTLIRVFLPHQTIVVGNYNSISNECRILDTRRAGHAMQYATTFPREFIEPTAPKGHPSTSGPLVLGDDIWLGYQTLLAGPSRIGHGAVTMSGSVVIQDVPPYAVVGGNPAKLLKMRFSSSVVEALLRIRWWDWPAATVRERVAWFDKPIGEFVEKFDPGN